jgi:hypothetical protein
MLSEIIKEIDEVPERYKSKIDRVFLADGDALIYPFEELSEILDKLSEAFT